MNIEQIKNLALWHAEHNRDGRGRTGVRIYKAMVRMEQRGPFSSKSWTTHRSALGWRAYYRRHSAFIDARVNELLAKYPDLPDKSEILAAFMYSAPTSSSMLYTAQEMYLLARYLAEETPDGRGRNGHKVYHKLVNNPTRWPWGQGHSPADWQGHYNSNADWYRQAIYKLQARSETHGKRTQDDAPTVRTATVKRRRVVLSSDSEVEYEGDRVSSSSLVSVPDGYGVDDDEGEYGNGDGDDESRGYENDHEDEDEEDEIVGEQGKEYTEEPRDEEPSGKGEQTQLTRLWNSGSDVGVRAGEGDSENEEVTMRGDGDGKLKAGGKDQLHGCTRSNPVNGSTQCIPHSPDASSLEEADTGQPLTGPSTGGDRNSHHDLESDQPHGREDATHDHRPESSGSVALSHPVTASRDKGEQHASQPTRHDRDINVDPLGNEDLAFHLLNEDETTTGFQTAVARKVFSITKDLQTAVRLLGIMREAAEQALLEVVESEGQNRPGSEDCV
ncbi:hypothetical protein BXZ70DRAFT_939120 [Cristinia sonorae]|uniref:Uncharacterized protein n=1 Tax=Cristinia sonorae TaxID=1940300 RepID=A0A8K0UNX3_9AGAR|nr:hypothetical protein BXZ70DRAFT_939120 [Cristinia sonorae]